MSKGIHRFTGFLWALLIAIISFFVIFIFFPDVSNKFFGVGIREPKAVGEKVSEIVSDAAGTAGDRITEMAGSVMETVIDKALDIGSDAMKAASDAAEAAGDAGEAVVDKVSEVVEDLGK